MFSTLEVRFATRMRYINSILALTHLTVFFTRYEKSMIGRYHELCTCEIVVQVCTITLQETFKHVLICRDFMTVTEPCTVCSSRFCKWTLKCDNYDDEGGHALKSRDRPAGMIQRRGAP